MPDDMQSVRGIDWKSTFPFTLIFRSFRVSIHPSKLVLALLSVLLIYIGGSVLDAIWPASSLAVPNEVGIYLNTRGLPDSSQEFSQQRATARAEVEDNFKQRLAAIGKPDGSLSDIKADILRHREESVDITNKSYSDAMNRDSVSAADKQAAASARDQLIAGAYHTARQDYDAAAAINGTGLFLTFIKTQIGAATLVFDAAVSGSWVGSDGALGRLLDLLTVAPGWAIRHHPVYFTIFGIYFLIVWAIFGGAIARIAAVQVARDEKLSFRQALSFSTAKFLSFVSAPIIPMLIVAAIGAIVALGSLILFNIPYIAIIGGALFFLALAAGFVMTLVLIGLIGGFNLMYPTIAVEGSDSFDAISRSFSYLFARPWRLVFYSIVAAIYGAICYAFVRYFILLMLGLTHMFVNSGIVFRDAPSHEPLLTAMWPNPLGAPTLSYQIDYLTLDSGDDIAATLMALWIYLTIAVLAAFAISFYFSANTIIYMLMRHEVDATELDDVYIEQTDEEFIESTNVTATATVAQAGETSPTGSEAGA